MSPPAEPIHATISGVAVVTIPLDHYAALLECRRLVAENDLRHAPAATAASRIGRDAEVEVFLTENLRGRTLEALYALCLERFGAARAPSVSSIARWRRRR